MGAVLLGVVPAPLVGCLLDGVRGVILLLQLVRHKVGHPEAGYCCPVRRRGRTMEDLMGVLEVYIPRRQFHYYFRFWSRFSARDFVSLDEMLLGPRAGVRPEDGHGTGRAGSVPPVAVRMCGNVGQQGASAETFAHIFARLVVLPFVLGVDAAGAFGRRGV